MRRFTLLFALLACHPVDPGGDTDLDPDDTDVLDTDLLDTAIVDDTDDTDVLDTDGTDTDTDPADTDAPSVTCGEEVCDGTTHYCLTSIPGQRPDTGLPTPDYTDCVALPAACVDDVSCACLVSEGEIPEFAECSGDGTTGLSALVAYP
jgi:hypothetical protein